MWSFLEILAWLVFFIVLDSLGIFPLWLLFTILAVAMIVLVWSVRRSEASSPKGSGDMADPAGRRVPAESHS